MISKKVSKKKIQVRWIQMYAVEEGNSPRDALGGDPTWEALIIDDEIVKGGDYYHNHIADYIKGYLDCFIKSNEMDFTRESFAFPAEETWDGPFIPDAKKALHHKVASRKYGWYE